MASSVPKKKLGRTDLVVSRIGLGTTEIGFTYGIGPRDVPSKEETIRLLHTIIEMGITFFDTAHFYGIAEERIGESGIAKKEGIVVATKCGHILDRAEGITREELEKQIRVEVDESRRKLDLETLPLVLYHGGSKEQIENGLLIEIMQKLKDEEKVRYAGISTRGEEAPLAAMASNFFDVIQIAYSIIDQRMAPDVLPKAKENDIGIVNRSVFLKGVLTPASQYLPKELYLLKEHSDKAKKIAEDLGTDLPSLALRFAISNDAISTSLVGSNKLSHLKGAVDAAIAGPLPSDVLERLSELALDDISLVDPAHWPPEAVSDSKGGKKIVPHFFKNNKK